MVTIGAATDGEDALSFPPPSPLLMARAYAETSLSFLRGKPDIAGFKNAIEHYKLVDLKSESPWLDGDTLLNCRQAGGLASQLSRVPQIAVNALQIRIGRFE